MQPTTEPGRERPGPRAERDLIVPLVDHPPGGPVYHRSIHRFALALGALGAAVLGILGGAVAGGAVPVAGLGQWGTAGTAVAAFTGAGIGAAVLGLAGALIALFRLPRRTPGRRGHEDQHRAGGAGSPRRHTT